MWMNNIPLRISSILSLAGIGVSLYLLDAQRVAGSGLCEIGNIFSCSAVLSSPYSSLLGLPMALYGVVWFALALALSLSSLRYEAAGLLLLGWSIAGVMGAAWLLYVEVALINAVCILCSAAHGLGAGILALSLLSIGGRRRASRG